MFTAFLLSLLAAILLELTTAYRVILNKFDVDVKDVQKFKSDIFYYSCLNAYTIVVIIWCFIPTPFYLLFLLLLVVGVAKTYLPSSIQRNKTFLLTDCVVCISLYVYILSYYLR